MQKIISALSAVLLTAVAAAADRLPEALKIDQQGRLAIGPAQLFLQHFGPEWKSTTQWQLKPDANYPKQTDSSFELAGRMPAGGSDSAFAVNETVSAAGANAFRVNYTLKADTPAPTNSLALAIDIPTGNSDIDLYIDGDQIDLPQTQGTTVGMFDASAGRVLISLPDRQIAINGDFRVVVQDNRSFKINTFTIRLLAKGAVKPVSDWSLAADFQLLPPAVGRFPAGVSVDDAGSLIFGKYALRWTCYTPDWRGVLLDKTTFKADANFPVNGPGNFESAGQWSGFAVNLNAAVNKNGVIAYSANFKADPPLETATLAMVMTLSAEETHSITVDGQKIELPAEFKDIKIVEAKKVSSFAFESDGRTITLAGDFTLLIQDDRKWNLKHFLVRIMTNPGNGKISNAALNFTVRVESPHTAQINLKNVFNMAFRDDKAEDGKGGWTDQGATNDLRMLNPGKLTTLGIDFDIVDPAKNDGKSCLVLSTGQKKFPSVQSVTPAVNEPYQYLYLLHASAWTPASGKTVGTIVAEFADGSTKEFPVVSGRDIGNWWQPYGFANGAVGWIGENSESFVGLYLSQFRLGDTPKKLTFKAADNSNALWMIVGAGMGDKQLELKQIETPSYIVADKDWTQLDFDGKTVAGSPLDFSVFTDSPAGKYGPVTINPNGHFSFRDAPDKRIRFFGPNLVGSSNYLDKQLADDFVAKAVRLGYNTIRFHHFENGLIAKGAPDSLTFDPQSVDQLDYLFAELKKHGIYLCLDLYASRALRPGDGIAEREGRTFERYGFEMKSLVMISPTAMENWKGFARKLLTHRNPYTGLTWGEDPALYSINLVNENPLLVIWNRNPALIPFYEAKYAEYLKAKGLDTPANRESRGGLFIEFLNDLQIRSIEEQKRFLRDELKVPVLITDLNMVSKYTLDPVRQHLEFVDNHQYWDHPSFPVQQWQMPYLFANSSSINRNAQNPRYLMPTRIFGKPYTITEFNFCNPNPFRAEGAPLIGGYAAMQDWDGLYRFAWSHSRENMEAVAVPKGFDIVNDPQAQLGERIINLLFMRDYIRPAKEAYAFTYTNQDISSITGSANNAGEYPAAFTELGLYARIGTLGPGMEFPGVGKIDALSDNWQAKLPTAARDALADLGKTGKITDADGQISLDAKAKALTIVAPKAEVMTFAGNAAGKVMKLVNGNRYQTVALLSLDGKPLSESKKILLFQLANLAGTKQEFANERRNLLKSWGQLPILVEKCRVDIELALPELKVEALKLDGSANGTIQSKYADGKLIFTADTAARPGGVMVYLLSR